MRTPEEIQATLGYIIDCYNAYREHLKLDHVAARTRTLETYDDFQEWLQGGTLVKTGTPRGPT